MSSIDYIHMPCIKCHKDHVEQTKAMPDPSGKHFNVAQAPLYILAEIKGKVYTCEHCNTSFTITVHHIAAVQPLTFTKRNPLAHGCKSCED